MIKNTDELRKELDAKIPRDAVKTREGGGRTSLSYLEGHYVIARMNELFGQGNWGYDIVDLQMVHSGVVEGKYGPVNTVHYISRMEVTAKVGDSSVRFVDVGYGDGSDKVNVGKAHELAVKEAITDGIKRCCKSFGMSLGLALYSKDQENVGDAEPVVVSKPAPAKPEPAKVAVVKQPETKRDVAQLKEIIRNSARILNDTRKLPIADFKVKFLQSAGVVKVDELSDAQTLSLFDTLKTSFPELKLT